MGAVDQGSDDLILQGEIGCSPRCLRPALPARPKVSTGSPADRSQVPCRGTIQPEIADQLHVSDQTIKTHLSRILPKLGLRDRTQAVVMAYETGLVAPRTRIDRGHLNPLYW